VQIDKIPDEVTAKTAIIKPGKTVALQAY